MLHYPQPPVNTILAAREVRIDPLIPLDFTDYIALAPDVRETWLVEPLLSTGGSLLIQGLPKAMKSAAMIGMGLAVASGRPWLQFPTRKQKVLYVQLDTPRSVWFKRLRRLAEHGHAPSPSTFITLDPSMVPYPFNILNHTHAEALQQAIAAHAPHLVIIDTLRKAFKGNENDSDVAAQVLTSFQAIAAPAALAYVHHSRKPSKDPFAESDGVIESVRGAGEFAAGVDTVLHLAKKEHFTGGSLQRTDGVLRIEGRETESMALKLLLNPKPLLWDLVHE